MKQEQIEDSKQIKRMMQCLYCSSKPETCGWDKNGENEKGWCLHCKKDETIPKVF